jgi:hypothetical protein
MLQGQHQAGGVLAGTAEGGSHSDVFQRFDNGLVDFHLFPLSPPRHSWRSRFSSVSQTPWSTPLGEGL